ncbi:putative HAT dimerization domain, ribonuclease H-like domain-containing protein [Rosa chinensis]|uniref:Putative HAT dimerization domain, ribonuclease H-like domain-containing protein n=1 Tax=Rosa chinensis TaxID=74649 RepID=A0A2P6PC90_ROSCH|nr:putative HAT dimerization domain, ribonuclease H-like domain-containing protein [Rosa chinensis]
MLNYLDSVVEEVGEENVVQIVTDNASNYKWAGKELMKYRSKLWWTPSAAHCIDLMLEDISKLKVFETTIQRAKQILKFIYGHTQVLSIMRKFTGDKEIIRPAVTRFATSFLSLQSLYKQRKALISMFSSKDWNECGCTKHKDAYDVRKWILRDGSFWNHVAYCIKSVLPLVCVLREVDSEVRPAMGFIYELTDAAKEKIAKKLGNVEARYGPIWRRIDNRLKCMDRMLDGEDRIKAEIQFDLYERKLGKFGSDMALSTRKKRSPVFWWEKYGTQTSELMNFATRVLSLTCSASGCERNWSTFEMIHTKKRNRLEHKRLHALVYVKYNISLRDRSMKRNATMIDPIVVEEIESDDEWITEIEDPVLLADPNWLKDRIEDLTLNDEAVRNVPVGSYQSTLMDREPILREPSPPPREPTLSLDEPIVLYKRKSSQAPSSSRRKLPRKSMRLEDIADDDIRTNPYEDTNPLFQHQDDDSDGDDSDGGDSDGGDSLDGDLLVDEEDDFQA